MNTQLKVLGHDLVPGYTEFRAFPSGTRVFTDLGMAPQFILSDNAYVGINRRSNNKSGLAKDVDYLTCLVVDIEPDLPKGTPSTEEQLNEAYEVAEKVQGHLGNNAVLVVSGSGFHVYLPIEPIKVTDHKALTKSLKAWSDNIQAKFATKTVRIDSIFDLSRIIRVWYTHNHKSNRKCEPLSVWSQQREKLVFDQTPETTIKVSFTTETSSETRFARLMKTNRLISECCNAGTTFASRSESDYAFIGELVKAGFNPTDIKVFAKRNPLGRMEELKDADIDRVVGKHVNNGIRTKSPTLFAAKYFDSLSNRTSGTSFGLAAIDKATGGLRAGEVAVIAARPGGGKTSFVCQMAYNMAKEGKVVLLFPTELSIGPVWDKIMAQLSGIPLHKFRDGSFTTAEMATLHSFKEDFAKYPLIVEENFGLTVEAFKKKVDDVSPDVVIVDYIQSMSYKEGGTPHELSLSMQAFVDVAGNRRIPVVATSQLSRPVSGTELSMAHLKGSGSLEEKSRFVGGLVAVDSGVNPRPVNFHILKSSYGETGVIPLWFHTDKCKFEERH